MSDPAVLSIRSGLMTHSWGSDSTAALTRGGCDFQACNIDEVMDAHDRYLGTILSKAMLDSHTEALRTILNSMFDCCQRSVLPLREAEAQIAAKAAMLQQVR